MRGQFFNSMTVRLITLVLMSIACIIAAQQVIVSIAHGNYFPINVVKVNANYQHVTRPQLKSIITPFVASGFFSIDIYALKDRLESLPWVEEVTISRRWPDIVDIRLIEQQAVARWGSRGVLNPNGLVFFPALATISSELPMLDGPKGYEKRLLQEYRIMSHILNGRGLYITELDMADRWAWAVHLSNGVTLLLGREKKIARLRRFLDVYQTVFGDKFNRVEVVDLRYSNGMAVRWKTA